MGPNSYNRNPNGPFSTRRRPSLTTDTNKIPRLFLGYRCLTSVSISSCRQQRQWGTPTHQVQTQQLWYPETLGWCVHNVYSTNIHLLTSKEIKVREEDNNVWEGIQLQLCVFLNVKSTRSIYVYSLNRWIQCSTLVTFKINRDGTMKMDMISRWTDCRSDH